MSLMNKQLQPWYASLYRCFAVRSCSTSGGAAHFDSWSCLGKLRRRSERLKGVLDKLKWLKISNFQASGQDYPLPMPADQARSNKSLSQAELEYAAGFFDGDGCVATGSGLGGCRLMISQTSDRGEALLLFYGAFGGSIHVQRHGQGSWKPSITWAVHGRAARRASALLTEASFVKKKQLQIAANWPDCRAERSKLQAELKILKRTPQQVAEFNASWSYAAGFFDAEGYVHIKAADNSVSLGFAQKYVEVLHHILLCIRNHRPLKGIGIIEVNGQFRLSTWRSATTKYVLKQLLASGLIVKRRSAEVAMKATASSHRMARAANALLAGRQGRYARLTEDGCDRARSIRNMYSRVVYLRLCSKLHEATMVQQELAELRHQHVLLNAQAQYDLPATLRHSLIAEAGCSHGFCESDKPRAFE
ncbi:unnamed protein product [Polarella glacialis]|uniref:Homing endonuclease LAGLIDADG domain-containing protein n=1 Tax=Polarella glacialis TaxID=89957 RepID=A0A813KQV5_POLGL|nr:unnamed protein product [Polarella glacialis]